jgi:hypothetical protein
MEIFLLLVILGVLILLAKNLSDVKNQLTRLDNELHEFKSFFRSSLLPGKEFPSSLQNSICTHLGMHGIANIIE